LGKGLRALIPDTAIDDSSGGDEGSRIVMLTVDSLVPNKFQPRRDFDEEKLKELADSIREHGVVQPIVARSIGDEKYEIVAGERRWRACRMLGMETIPAVIKEYTDGELTQIALIENIQREDLNPLEEAYAYDMLIKEFSFTQEELARRIGKSRPFVANMLRLLHLEKDVQKMVEDNKLSIGHARALLALKGRDQVELAEKIIEEGLTVRQTEEMVKRKAEKGVFLKSRSDRSSKKKNKNEKPPAIKDLEERLNEIFGTKVRIHGKNKGKIVIEYYGQEELERIVEIIMKMCEN